MLAIALFGVVAYRGLPVSDLPTVDYPTLIVSASLPGADPETMAATVATPLERQFTTIAGLDSMISYSRVGAANVVLTFDLNRDIDSAAVDVQTAIAEVGPLLPPGMPAPPAFWKANPAAAPVMIMSLTTQTMTMSDLDEYAENLVAKSISMVAGVAQVQVGGAAKYAVRVQVDPDKLNAKKIGIDEVDGALQNWNVNLPTGTLFGPRTAYNVVANGQLMNASEFQKTIVAWRNGSPVRLDEVAHVIDSVEDDKQASWVFNHELGLTKAISLQVMRQPGSNTIEVTDAIRRLLPTFRAQLPPAATLRIGIDRSMNIRASYRDVQVTMVVTLSLVILVIFLFLRNASATLIPSMALPFSILGTFAMMSVLNYSLDNLSMMALILSIGFVVDDAIVMLENIVRHMEMGETPLQAALTGSREVGFTIVSMTVSLAAVFIPVLFLGGILGRLFREFAVTICTAILISGLVSITLTPMLCSRFLKASALHGRGWFDRVMDRFFRALHRGYEWSLRGALRHRYVMLAVFFGVIVATGVLFQSVPKGFIPETDADQMMLQFEAAQGTSYYQMLDYVKNIDNILVREPNIDSFFMSVGGNYGGTSNQGRAFINLKPLKQRALSVGQIIQKLRPQFGRFPGFRVFLMAPAAIQIGGRMSKSSYDFTLQGPDTDLLYRESVKLESEMARIPILQDVTTDLQIKTPRVNLKINRDRAATLGINSTQIENSLYSAFGPKWSSTIYAPTNQYRVLLEIQPKYQAFADYLSKLYFKSPATGALIPLDSVVDQTQDASPQSVNHSGQLPSVTVSFNLQPGHSIGEAVEAVQDVAYKTLPASIIANFQGQAAAFQSSLRNLSLLLVVAIMIVFIVLGVLYESYIHPLTILSGLPAAGVGALLTLMLFHLELNVYSFVGLMMLIGIVKKNAIMQIDFALEAERKHAKTPAEAILEGCLIRFRPIMMTTMAALLGSIPIALGYGAGGEARRPLGMAVAGGLVFSQLITLYLTPVIYTYMAELLQWWRRRWSKHLPAPAPAYTD